MYEKYVNTLEARLRMFGGALKGCSEEDIEVLMRTQGVTFLPEVYRQFLRIVGRGSTDVFTGSDINYYDLLGMKEIAKALIVAERKYSPDAEIVFPDDTFVFFMHQGYQFYYFLTADRDNNPAVCGFHEGMGKPVKKYESLTRFFDSCINEKR